MARKSGIYLFGLLFAAGIVAIQNVRTASAQWEDAAPSEDNSISIYATACEPVRQKEPKSSLRVRATDKATFRAVENAAPLRSYRDNLSSHNFNVLVYTIVDNYVEDLNIRTTEQTAERLCVEVTGYISPDKITQAAEENRQKFAVAEEKAEDIYPEKLELESETPISDALNSLPPKPQVNIKKEIAAETVLKENQDWAAPNAPVIGENVVAGQVSEAAPHQGTGTQTAPVLTAQPGDILVYIEKTKFYNDTETANFFKDIKQVLDQRGGIAVIRDSSQADYIIRPKVLRAKVDPINRQTNRLQMVIAVELVNTEKGSTITEHQNRFILFESTENEQTTAAALMKKLLRKAVENISGEIKTKNGGAPGGDAMITPTSLNRTAPSY